MAARGRTRKQSAAGGVTQPRASAPASFNASIPAASGQLDLPTLEAFIVDGGQISIGKIRPIRCAAVANDDHQMLAALKRRPGETLIQLLVRLDAAVHLALEEEQFTDEINDRPSNGL